jgi:hypothetical protein
VIWIVAAVLAGIVVLYLVVVYLVLVVAGEHIKY